MVSLVLTYPKISERDFAWIQSVRKEHDERYVQVVDPHFTLVFPTAMEAGLLAEHTRRCASRHKAFPFTLRCAVVVEDDSKEYSHVFLVPDEGNSDIVRLHDDLYSGSLDSELRLDIPFIPHIGIGNSNDPRQCKKLADKLNSSNFVIPGAIDMLDVVIYENNTVVTAAQIELPGRK